MQKEGNHKIINKVFDNMDQTQDITLISNEEIEKENNISAQSLSLAGQEKQLIIKSLEKHKGKRKLAAKELGISERTLYRKIKEFDL